MKIVEEINKIYQKNKKIKLFLDMDGTIIELLFDSEEIYLKKGKYLNKKPIKPIINRIKEINKKFPLIKINIISCSKTKGMIIEKNEWLNKYMPDIQNGRRILLCEETGDYTQKNVNSVKAQYIKNSLKENELAILIDDDIRVLSAAKKIINDRILLFHVTSLLI